MTREDWISVESQLPAGGEKRYGIEVLVCILHYATDGHQHRNKKIVYYKDHEFWHSVGGVKIGEKIFQRVTHWMYLPDFPKKHTPYCKKQIT